MGGLKKCLVFENDANLLSGWATWRVGVRKPKRYLWWAANSGYSQATCRFNDGVCWAFGFPRACLPINSILCPLLLFFHCIFSEIAFSFNLVRTFAFFWVKLQNFLTVICILTVFALRFCNPCSSLTFGTYSLCLVLFFSALWCLLVCCWFVWASVACDWVF